MIGRENVVQGIMRRFQCGSMQFFLELEWVQYIMLS
jgi:hypothetical protein